MFMYIWVVNVNCWSSWTVCNTCVFLLAAFQLPGYVTCRSLVLLSSWWGGACIIMHKRDVPTHVNVCTYLLLCMILLIITLYSKYEVGLLGLRIFVLIFKWNIPIVLQSNIHIAKHCHAQCNLQNFRLPVSSF